MRMNPPVKYLACIVNYRSEEYVKQCVASITASAEGLRDACEIIIADNSPGILREHYRGRPGVRVLELDGNPGYGLACNAAVRATAAEWIMIVNPDVLFRPSTFRAVESAVNQGNSPGPGLPGRPQVFTGRILDPDGGTQVRYDYDFSIMKTNYLLLFETAPGRFIVNKLLSGRYLKRRYFLKHSDREIQKVDNPSGAFFVIEKALFDSMGGFDGGIFLYFEDTDLFYRLKKAGYAAYYLPSIEVLHKGGVSTDTAKVFSFLAYKKSLFYFLKKHGAPNLRLKRLILAADAVLLMLSAALRSPVKKAGLIRGLAGLIKYYLAA